MKLVLIGMRGSGKSTVGKIMAEALKCRFLESDKLIEKRMKKAVKDIIGEMGLDFFRDLESKVIISLENEKDCVIATGGGVIERNSNMQSLNKDGIIIYLDTTPEISATRLSGDNGRPILTGALSIAEDLKKLYERRKNIYEKWSDITVPTDGRTIDEIVDAVIKKLPNNL